MITQNTNRHVFLFGLQIPLVSWFLQVERWNVALPCGDGLAEKEMEMVGSGWHRHRFTPLHVAPSISGSRFGFADMSTVIVVEHLSFVYGGHLVGNGLHSSLAEWEERWPSPTPDGGTPRQPAPTAAERREATESHGWAEEYLQTTTSTRPRCSSGGHVHDERLEPPSCEEVLAAVWRRFDESLAPGQDAALYDGEDFFLRLRDSTSWTGRGAPCSDEGCVATEAKRGEPRRWCGEYGFRVSATFPIGSLTLDGAMALAEEWCRRHQFFYNMYRRADSDSYKYPSDMSSYTHTEGWLEFTRSASASGAIRDRIVLVEALAPVNP